MIWQLRNAEDRLQKAVCEYLDLSRVLYHAVPNGYKKTAFEQWKAKVTGLKSGVPDLFLAVARGQYHGFYLELKSDKGRLEESQIQWLDKLEQQGYHVAVANSFGRAKLMIDEYMAL